MASCTRLRYADHPFTGVRRPSPEHLLRNTCTFVPIYTSSARIVGTSAAVRPLRLTGQFVRRWRQTVFSVPRWFWALRNI